MLKKKCMSFFLAMLMVLSTVIFSAGTVAAETSSAMTVAANNSELAVKTEFSAEQDHVQRVGNLFRPLNDPARTSNNPVDFGQTYLVAEDDTDLWTIDTRITGDTQNTQDEATPFMINGSYIGANHGQNSGMYVTVTGHGLGYADVGSRWTTTAAAEESDPVTINWNLLRIVDENTLLFLSDGTFQKGAYTYGFSTQLSASDTMTRVGSAGSLTVESVTVNQVYPSIRHTKKTAYAVSGGLKWKIEPNTSYDCDYVVIEESYQIIDPSTIAEAVRANAPTGGYTANPDLTVGGEAMMNYNVVYTLLPDGTVLTEVDHEVLKAIRIDSYGLLQYPKRTDYAGGGIYRYLPNTKSFEARAVGQAASETTGFDFSVPTKIIGENAAAYPNSYVYRNADCVDPSYPNERTIDFFSDGSKDAATFASGYLPVGMGAKDKLAGISSGFYFYSSYKAYPQIYQSAMQDGPGTILSGVGYKKLYAGGRSDNMNVYTVPYGDTLYTYVDMFATGKSYTLPAGYAVVNQSANVTISAGVATANFAEGDTHGYLVVSSANTEATASVTAASVLAQLTKESISSEPLDFVTKNLIIPEMMSDTGVTLTWESSNENVISANGTVTRPTLAAETVTLKAIATDGSGSQEKNFTVTVAPLTVKEVSTNDNFASGLSNWSSSNLPGTIAGDDSNHYASFAANTTSGWPAASAALPALTSLGGTGTYTMEYKIQLPSTTTNEYVRVNLKANGKVISSISLVSGKMMIVQNGGTDVWHSVNGASNGSYTIGNWATFKTIIDPIHNTRRIFYNGSEVMLSDNSFYNGSASGNNTLGAMPTSLGMEIAIRNPKTTFTVLLDDLKVYTEDTPETFVQSLTDEGKVNWMAGLIQSSDITMENHIAVTQNLTLNTAYSAFDLEACGISVNWVSSDPSVISAEGIVTGGLGAKTVTMTANITAGEASDTVSVPLIVVQPNTTAISNATYAVNDFEGEASTLPAMSTGQLNGGTVAYAADEDVSHGTVLKLTNPGDGASYSDSSAIYGLLFNRRYFVNFDMKYERTASDTAANAYGGIELLGVIGSMAGSASLKFGSRQVGLYTSLVQSDGTVENVEMLYDMPASVREGEWVTVTYDYNLVSRTYQVYLNGELINDMPLLKANITHTNANHPLRGFKLAASKNGVVSMDNLTIRESTADASMANGGLNAALITYASADLRSTLTARESLQATGPSTSVGTNNNANLVQTDYAGNPGMYNFTGGAALTYTLDGKTVTSVSPTVPETKTFTISSTYNGVTETKTVQRQLAPVSVDSITAGKTITKVTLSGTIPTGGKVVVATYTNNGTVLADAQMFDAAAVLTPNMSMSNIDTVKVFVLNNATDLQPVTYVKLK